MTVKERRRCPRSRSPAGQACLLQLLQGGLPLSQRAPPGSRHQRRQAPPPPLTQCQAALQHQLHRRRALPPQHVYEQTHQPLRGCFSGRAPHVTPSCASPAPSLAPVGLSRRPGKRAPLQAGSRSGSGAACAAASAATAAGSAPAATAARAHGSQAEAANSARSSAAGSGPTWGMSMDEGSWAQCRAPVAAMPGAFRSPATWAKELVSVLGRVAGSDMSAGSSEAARCSTGPDAPCRAPVVAEPGASRSSAGMVNAMGAVPGRAAGPARVLGHGGAAGYGAPWDGSSAAALGALCSSASRADGLGSMPSKGAGADRAAGSDGVAAPGAPDRGPAAAEWGALRSSATRAATSDSTAPLSASSLHGGPPLLSGCRL